MVSENPKLKVQIDPARLSRIIDAAVLISSEIVNFHFNALSNSDLTQTPMPANAGTFGFAGPTLSADQRLTIHQNWILAKAFQELLRAVRHSLEVAHVYTALLTKTHRISSSSTLDDFLAPFRKKAAGKRFPELLDAVNEQLNPKINFSKAYVSLQIARNCLEHGAGIVSKRETRGGDALTLTFPHLKIFYLRDGQEIDVVAGETIDAGDGRPEVDIYRRLDVRSRTIGVGERISISHADFNEICFACHYLGQQLSSNLPRPKIEPIAQ